MRENDWRNMKAYENIINKGHLARQKIREEKWASQQTKQTSFGSNFCILPVISATTLVMVRVMLFSPGVQWFFLCSN